MIHLAKFSGAPAARAEELVAQIAAAVEGLSELTWQDDAGAPPENCRAEHFDQSDCSTLAEARTSRTV